MNFLSKNNVVRKKEKRSNVSLHEIIILIHRIRGLNI